MDDSTEISRIPMQITHDYLVVSVQTDLNQRMLIRFQHDLLNRIHKSQPAGVIMDLSGLAVIDAHEFAALKRVISMARVMGVETVLCGLQPGVAASLVTLDVDFSGLRTTFDLEDAFLLFRSAADESIVPVQLEQSDAEDLP